MKRERSLATLESLYQRTKQAREQAAIQRTLDTGLFFFLINIQLDSNNKT